MALALDFWRDLTVVDDLREALDQLGDRLELHLTVHRVDHFENEVDKLVELDARPEFSLEDLGAMVGCLALRSSITGLN